MTENLKKLTLVVAELTLCVLDVAARFAHAPLVHFCQRYDTPPGAPVTVAVSVADWPTYSSLPLADALRRAGIAVDLGLSGNLKRRMQQANRAGARVAVLLGDDEIARSVATVRDMESGEQREVPIDRLAAALAP